MPTKLTNDELKIVIIGTWKQHPDWTKDQVKRYIGNNYNLLDYQIDEVLWKNDLEQPGS